MKSWVEKGCVFHFGKNYFFPYHLSVSFLPRQSNAIGIRRKQFRWCKIVWHSSSGLSWLTYLMVKNCLIDVKSSMKLEPWSWSDYSCQPRYQDHARKTKNITEKLCFSLDLNFLSSSAFESTADKKKSSIPDYSSNTSYLISPFSILFYYHWVTVRV